MHETRAVELYDGTVVLVDRALAGIIPELNFSGLRTTGCCEGADEPIWPRADGRAYVAVTGRLQSAFAQSLAAINDGTFVVRDAYPAGGCVVEWERAHTSTMIERFGRVSARLRGV